MTPAERALLERIAEYVLRDMHRREDQASPYAASILEDRDRRPFEDAMAGAGMDTIVIWARMERANRGH
jgi:hypothetical protein